MCRTGIRHCRTHYTRNQRDLENARRRLSRNDALLAEAEANENTKSIERYSTLRDKAVHDVTRLEEEVRLEKDLGSRETSKHTDDLRKVSGDAFQAAEPCPPGYIDLYHRTTSKAVAVILSSYAMVSAENTDEAYFSTFNGTEEDAQNSDYGEAVVWVRVPEDSIDIDDEFPSGEEHYRVPLSILSQGSFMVQGKDGRYYPADQIATVEEHKEAATKVQPVTRLEANASWRDFEGFFSQQHPDVDMSVSRVDNIVTVHRIVAKSQGNGLGTKAMQSLLQSADEHGWTVALTPSTEFGGTKKRLLEFYTRLGFVKNAGTRKNFATREAMYRPAQVQ